MRLSIVSNVWNATFETHCTQHHDDRTGYTLGVIGSWETRPIERNMKKGVGCLVMGEAGGTRGGEAVGVGYEGIWVAGMK